MDPGTIVQKEDCEVARTPEELIAWIESIHAQLVADDSVKEYARLGKGLTKQFYEEIMSLGHLARHKYWHMPGVKLRPRIGNQNYDAEIIGLGGAVTRIEFVSAYRDHDLALRMEHLVQHGGVPLTGPVRRDGIKAAGGQVRAQLVAVDQEEKLGKQIRGIQKGVEEKLTKTYETGTALGVVIDDYLAVDPDKDLLAVNSFVQTEVSELALEKFSSLFIIGASGKTFLEF